MQIQSIIFYKTGWTKAEAILWLTSHSKLYEIEENNESYIAPQIDPSLFDRYSFRVREINAGMDFIIGKLI